MRLARVLLVASFRKRTTSHFLLIEFDLNDFEFDALFLQFNLIFKQAATDVDERPVHPLVADSSPSCRIPCGPAEHVQLSLIFCS